MEWVNFTWDDIYRKGRVMKHFTLAFLISVAIVTAYFLVKTNRKSKSGYVPECGNVCDGIMYEYLEE